MTERWLPSYLHLPLKFPPPLLPQLVRALKWGFVKDDAKMEWRRQLDAKKRRSQGVPLDLLPHHAPPTPLGPRPRGILGHVVFSFTKSPPALLPLALETSWRRVPPVPFLLPLSISRSSVPGFGGPFTTLGLRVGLGPLFGKVTWTSTAMAEGEEVLPLPTSSGDRWWVKDRSWFFTAPPFFLFSPLPISEAPAGAGMEREDRLDQVQRPAPPPPLAVPRQPAGCSRC